MCSSRREQLQYLRNMQTINTGRVMNAVQMYKTKTNQLHTFIPADFRYLRSFRAKADFKGYQ